MNSTQENLGKPSSEYHKLILVGALTALIILMVLDILLVRVYDLISKQFVQVSTRELLFSAVAISFLVAQYLLLELTKPVEIEHRKGKLRIGLLYKITKACQYSLGVLILYVITTVIFNSYYSSVVLLAIVLISYGLSIFILGSLVTRVLFRISFSRAGLIAILFAFALGGVMTNAMVAMIDLSFRLSDRPVDVRLYLGGSVDVGKGRYNTLDTLYFLTYTISFICAWIATIALMRYYIHRLGRIKFWVIAVSPLLFFLGQFVSPFVGMISALTGTNPYTLSLFVTVILTLSKPIGGLMLGIAFWSMAKIGSKYSYIRRNLIISGFGFLLLFTSNQALLMSITPYPPFGLSTILIMGFAAYLVYIGIFTTITSISQNTELRKFIRQLARSELLDSMASIETQINVESKVLEIIKKESVRLENETGVESSLTYDDAKRYLEEVLEELKKTS
jgi:hypothetical protein